MPNEAHIIALAGNPNVGKSTVFNALTGLRQHTGNWPGKTVAAARGDLTYGGERFTLVDLPGTYSLFPNSAEEEIARDYLCSGEAEAVLILADATCLERSLNLVLQTLEAADIPAVVCVNLLDEAAKKGIVLDLPALSRALGVPVVGTAASCGEGLDELRLGGKRRRSNIPARSSARCACWSRRSRRSRGSRAASTRCGCWRTTLCSSPASAPICPLWRRSASGRSASAPAPSWGS